MVACLKTVPSITTMHANISTMPNPDLEGEHRPTESDDGIDAAVRDAARKTQERMAAYHKKQAAKAALEEQLQQQQKEKAPSQDRLQAESTVSRLQALVSESKRLTNKSRELYMPPAVQLAAAAQFAEVPSTPTPRQSPSLSNCATGESASLSARSSSRARPKANKLSDIFQALDGSHVSLSEAMTPGKSSSSVSASVQPSPSSNESTVQGLMPVVLGVMSHTSLSQINKGRNSRRSTIPTLEIEGNDGIDEDISGKDQEGDGDNTNNPGEYSISSLVENRKQPALVGIGTLPQEEIDEMIQEYYSTPADEVLKVFDPSMDASLPPLEEILESPKPMASKSKVTGSAKKKRKPPIMPSSSKGEKNATAKSKKEDLDGSMPVLSPFETPKVERPKLTSSSLSGLKQDDEILDNDEFLMIQEVAEASLNLSQFMSLTQTSPEPRTQVAQNNHDSSDSSCASNTGGLRRPSLGQSSSSAQSEKASRKGSNLPLNLSKLHLVVDNASRQNDYVEGTALDDDDKSTLSAASASSLRGGRHRQPTRRGRDKDEDARSATSRSRSSRSKSVKGRKKASQQSSLSSGMSDRSKKSEGKNVSLSIINKYHKKADESLQSFPDEVSVGERHRQEGNAPTKTIRNESKTELDVSELSGSSASDGNVEAGPGIGNGSDSLSGSSNSRQGSTRRGRDGNDNNKDRSRSRTAVRRAASMRSASRSAPAVRCGRRPDRGASEGGTPDCMGDGSIKDLGSRDGAMRDKSARASSVRRSRVLEGNGSMCDLSVNEDADDGSMRDISTRDRSSRDVIARASSVRRSRAREGNGSMRDVSSSDAIRQRRSISTRRGAGRRGPRRKGEHADDDDASQASTADEILGSLDVSDIKIVGADDDELDSSLQFDPNSSRTSIYDRKQKRPSVIRGSNSLIGLSKLQPEEGSRDGEESVSESVSAKKSLMGKLARSVGRKLTGKKKKKKKDSNAEDDDEDDEDDDDDDEEVEEGTETTDMDTELRALAAEYDKEELDIDNNSSFESSFSKSDFGQDNPAGEEPEVKKSKKKRASVMLSKIKKVGSKLTRKKKKKNKDLKGAEALDSDSDSDDDDIQGSEYSGGTQERSHSNEDDDNVDFAQLRIDGDAASMAMCSSDRSEPQPISQIKGRQRRTSAVIRRHTIADRQRSQSLQAVLGGAGNGYGTRGDDATKADEDAAVMMDTKRARRVQSLRGRPGQGDHAGARLGSDVKRHQSLKMRIEGENGVKGDKGKRLRRSQSGDPSMVGRVDGDDEIAPPFNWKAYGAEKETSQNRKGKEKRKPQGGKRMSGGLSKVIYCGQTVSS
jgi:hypothetical protein